MTDKPKRKPKGGLSPKAIERAERDQQALKLRMAGHRLEEIATRLGMANRTSAKRAVQQALDRRLGDADETFRALELERTAAIIARLWPLVDRDPPDLDALDRLMKVLDYRAKITGLYAPRRQEVQLDVQGGISHEVTSRKLDAVRTLESVVDEVMDADRREQEPADAEIVDEDDHETDTDGRLGDAA